MKFEIVITSYSHTAFVIEIFVLGRAIFFLLNIVLFLIHLNISIRCIIIPKHYYYFYCQILYVHFNNMRGDHRLEQRRWPLSGRMGGERGGKKRFDDRRT